MIRSTAKAGLMLVVAAMSIGASAPRALGPAVGGLWAVSAKANGANARRACVVAPVALAQWQHRGQRCTRVVISDQGNRATIQYTCADGGFGRSEMTLVTPRTLRIATQGIARDGPFNYVVHARRMGNCSPR